MIDKGIGHRGYDCMDVKDIEIFPLDATMVMEG